MESLGIFNMGALNHAREVLLVGVGLIQVEARRAEGFLATDSVGEILRQHKPSRGPPQARTSDLAGESTGVDSRQGAGTEAAIIAG